MTIKVTYNVTDVYVSETISATYINISYEAPIGAGAVWGGITGTLSNQTDLQTALDAKFDDPTGTTLQYLRGDGTLATFPTITSGTVTSVGLTSATSGVTIGSSPITSSGNITLAISTASGSVNGLLSSTDWTTFNSKQNALTNPITGTGTSGQVAYFTGATTQAGSNNLFWDITNGRLGIGTNVPRQSLHISNTSNASIYLEDSDFTSTHNITELINSAGSFLINTRSSNGTFVSTDYYITKTATTTIHSWAKGDNSLSMRLFNTGNLLLQNGGTFTDSGQRLQVTGDTLLKGSGNTSATTGLLVQDSAGINLFRVSNGGFCTLSGAYGMFFSMFTTSGGTASVSGSNTQFYNYTTTQAATSGAFLFTGDAFSHTSGFNHTVFITKSFLPTSGNGSFSNLTIQPGNINQTGGANGITRGLYVNPTLTAAADWRSIETSNNTGFAFYGAGTAPSQLGGALTVAGGLTLSSGILSLPTAIHSVFGGNYRFWFRGSNRWTFEALSANLGFEFKYTATSVNAFNIVNSSDVSQFLVSNLGNTLIGSTTDSGQKLQVTGDTLLKGSGATEATAALIVQNSSSTELLRIGNSGIISSAQGYQFGAGGVISSSATNHRNIRFSAGATNLLGAYGSGIANSIYQFSYANSNNTDANTNSLFGIVHTFNPTSGTSGYIMAGLQPTINQTGGANGITRGLYVNPTLTAAADWRSIEWSNNSGWGLYGAGTAANYLAGRTSIGILPATLWSSYTGVLQIGQGFFTDYSPVPQFGISSNVYYNGTNAIILRTGGSGSINFENNGDITIQNNISQTAGAISSATNKMVIKSATGNILIQTGGTFTDSGEKLQVSGTAKITGKILANGSTSSVSGLEVGSINFQYFAVNNAFIAENTFYNGTAWQRVNTGLASVCYFAGGGFQVSTLPSGSAGTTQTSLNQRFFVTNEGKVSISDTITGGGNITQIATAVLQVDSTTKGFLPPRMTTTQINAIATPAEGLQVYNTTINHMCFYQSGAWQKINHSPM